MLLLWQKRAAESIAPHFIRLEKQQKEKTYVYNYIYDIKQEHGYSLWKYTRCHLASLFTYVYGLYEHPPDIVDKMRA